MIIHQESPKINTWADGVLSAPRTHLYQRVPLRALGALNARGWLTYARVLTTASVGSKRYDVRHIRRPVRRGVSKSTANRYLAKLIRSGLAQRVDKYRRKLTTEKGGRPVSLSFLRAIMDPNTAQHARFVLLLAAWRGHWRTLTVRTIAARLHVDTCVAAEYARWLSQAAASGLTRRRVRMVVFVSARPWWYRVGLVRRLQCNMCGGTHGHHCPLPPPRSGDEPPLLSSLDLIRSLDLVLTSRQPSGQPPPEKADYLTIHARGPTSRSVAERSERCRAPGQRFRGSPWNGRSTAKSAPTTSRLQHIGAVLESGGQAHPNGRAVADRTREAEAEYQRRREQIARDTADCSDWAETLRRVIPDAATWNLLP